MEKHIEDIIGKSYSKIGEDVSVTYGYLFSFLTPILNSSKNSSIIRKYLKMDLIHALSSTFSTLFH